MVKHTVRLAVDLTIKEGMLEAFEGVARTMVAGSHKEPGTLEYDWFLSADRKKCRLLELYTDANAVLAHFNGAGGCAETSGDKRTSAASRFMGILARS